MLFKKIQFKQHLFLCHPKDFAYLWHANTIRPGGET